MENQALTIFDERKSKIYCSKVLKTEEEKKAMFNTLENCDVLLNNCVGNTIEIQDVYVEEKEVLDAATGELKKKYRTILFDKDGMSYVTTSYGIYNVLLKIIGIYGYPDTWKEPLKVEVKKRPIDNNRQILTLKLL